MAEELWLGILALIGLIISTEILSKKRKKKPMVCMIGDNACTEVVNSKYSTTFGVDNASWGFFYYLIVMLYSVLANYGVDLFAPVLTYWIKLVLSGGAAVFSVYLTYIQLGVLKKVCEYCLASAAVSMLIFIAVVL